MNIAEAGGNVAAGPVFFRQLTRRAVRARRGAGTLVCLLAICLLTACTKSIPYWTSLGPRPGPHGELTGPTAAEVNRYCPNGVSDACISIVEFDEFGNPMNRAQLLGAIQQADSMGQTAGTIVVYVHGWHESARQDAPDLKNFREFISRVSTLEQKKRVGEGRRTGNVLGIYVGWRGDSIDVRSPSSGDATAADPSVTLPASYALTFWDRKSAAQRIGASGGVYELFKRLSAIRKQYPDSRLVIQGHSFGGALVYSAFSNALVDQIMDDASPTKNSLPSLFERPDGQGRTSPVADLVVLINPAFEAMRLRPQFDLARSQEYPNGPAVTDYLPPRLVIVTTQSDWATNRVFPAGRTIGTLTAAYTNLDGEARAQNITAVGHYLPLVTHQLAATTPEKCMESNASPAAEPDSASDIQRASLCIPPTFQPDVTERVPNLLLARCDKTGDCAKVAGNHYIVRGPVSKGLVPNRLPIMNIRTTSEVSNGHTDVWNATLQGFMLHLTTLSATRPANIPAAPPLR